MRTGAALTGRFRPVRYGSIRGCRAGHGLGLTRRRGRCGNGLGFRNLLDEPFPAGRAVRELSLGNLMPMRTAPHANEPMPSARRVRLGQPRPQLRPCRRSGDDGTTRASPARDPSVLRVLRDALLRASSTERAATPRGASSGRVRESLTQAATGGQALRPLARALSEPIGVEPPRLSRPCAPRSAPPRLRAAA